MGIPFPVSNGMTPEYGALGKQFRSPEEEIVYLRAQILDKEKIL
ncbi:MAG: hypothetical protein Q7K40_03665 [bacterium]|nr:hypothetical protein [bacterium]